MAEIEIIRRALEAGSDFGQMTQQRADALVKSLVEAGEVQRDQAQKLVTDIVERSRENRERLLATIDREVKNSVGRMGLATKEDLDVLRRKVTRLEKAAKKPAAKKPAAKKPAAKKTAKKKAAPSAAGK